MSRAIVGVFALAIVAMMAVGGFQVALENAGDDITVQNETWTPDAGNVTVLDDSERTGAYYADNVSVWDENGTEMEPVTDYVWFTGNGTIKTVTGGALDGDANATITYEYQQTTEEQRQFAAMLGQLPRAVGLVFPALLVVLFLIIAQQ